VQQLVSSLTPITAGRRRPPYILVVNANLLDYQKGDDPTFVAHQGLEGLQRLAPAWTALAHSLRGARFMHFPEWYRAYLSSLAPDPARVWFIGAYRDQELVAVFPLEFQNHRVGGLRPHVVGTIDDEQMQLSDFVFAQTAENEDLLYQLTQWLRTQRTLRWHELRLRKVPEDSSIAHAFRARLPTGTVALRHDGSSYFLTNATYDEATRAMSGSFKRNLRRLARRAEQSAPLRFQSYRRPEALSEAFEILINIEASGWKGNSGTASAICCRPAMLEFYRALVREFGARDACVINVLWHGEHAVAGQFCLHIGTTLNVLKIGFSDAHSHIAPGNLLLERTIQHACEDRRTDVVSLVNQPPWSKSFKPLTIGVWSYCAPNWSVQGCLVHLGLLGKRAWDTINRPRATEDVAAGNDAETHSQTSPA
jgi:CelD/BcsL family acetyltransferase involved in cellulose biosynthesis